MASAYLTRTPSSNGNRKTFTLSGWFKKSNVGSFQRIISSRIDGTNYNGIAFSSDKIQFSEYQGGDTINLVTSRLFRDASAWYHIVVAVDTTQGTASNRVKFYINGVQETSFSTSTYPSQNLDTVFNSSSSTHRIGTNDDASGGYFDGYMTHVNFVDGTALTPTSFGQSDSNGVWIPKPSPSVTYGTNGFFLKMDNSGNMGLDSSGNSNNFTTSGTITQAKDTPSNVFATLNGAFNLSDNVLSNGNNKAVNANANWKYVPATLGASSGKFYAEYKVNKGSGYLMVGVVDMEYAVSQDQNSYTHSGAGTGSASIYSDNGYKYLQSSDSIYAAPYTDNDIIGVALDMDNGKVYFSKNGAWSTGSGSWGSSTFDSAVGAITLPTTGTYTFAVSQRSGAYNETNFGNGYFGTTAVTSAGTNASGNGIFEYDVPTGYTALSTKGLNL